MATVRNSDAVPASRRCRYTKCGPRAATSDRKWASCLTGLVSTLQKETTSVSEGPLGFDPRPPDIQRRVLMKTSVRRLINKPAAMLHACVQINIHRTRHSTVPEMRYYSPHPSGSQNVTPLPLSPNREPLFVYCPFSHRTRHGANRMLTKTIPLFISIIR